MLAPARAVVLAASLACLLASCSPRMSGTYAADADRLEFQSDGTVYVTSFGGTFACTYEIDGAHVIVHGPNGSQVLTRDGDRLQSGLGMTWVLQSRTARTATAPHASR